MPSTSHKPIRGMSVVSFMKICCVNSSHWSRRRDFLELIESALNGYLATESFHDRISKEGCKLQYVQKESVEWIFVMRRLLTVSRTGPLGRVTPSSEARFC